MAKTKTDGYGNYKGTAEDRDLILGSLPPIAGTWYFVDPTDGLAANDGLAPGSAKSSIEDAYDLCTSGDGDGICVFSRGTSTAGTTSYLKQSLTWSKHGITVVGIAAPVSMYGRARIANKDVTTASLTTCAQTAHTITREAGSFATDGWEVGMKGTIADSGSNNSATFTITKVEALTLTVSETLNVQSKAQTASTTLLSYCLQLIEVTGNNNTFMNLHFYNGGASAYSYGCVKISGHRNYFEKCSIMGSCGTAAATTNNSYDVMINGGQENTFVKCALGTDTVLWSGNGCKVKFDSDAWRTRFYECEFLVWSATAGTGAINSADADAIDGWQLFKGCTFLLWNEDAIGASTALVIGTKPTNGQILFDQCTEFGWAAWGAAGLSGCLYVGSPTYAASAAGGIATTL
jgi:hypothetical protein